MSLLFRVVGKKLKKKNREYRWGQRGKTGWGNERRKLLRKGGATTQRFRKKFLCTYTSNKRGKERKGSICGGRRKKRKRRGGKMRKRGFSLANSRKGDRL